MQNYFGIWKQYGALKKGGEKESTRAVEPGYNINSLL